MGAKALDGCSDFRKWYCLLLDTDEEKELKDCLHRFYRLVLSDSHLLTLQK